MVEMPIIRSLPAYRKWLVAIAAAVGIFTLLGFFALPAILKPVIRDAVTGALHRKTAIREVRLNPFTLSASLRGVEISERDGQGTWISAEEIFANLELASVIRGGPVLGEIRLEKPYVSIVRRPDGSYNFSDILEELQKKPKDKSKPLKYSFNNIQVIDGRLDFLDGPKNARHVVDGIQISVPFVSNMRYRVDRYVTPSFSAIVNGNAVSLKGKTKPFQDSLETSFDINIMNFVIPEYLEYVPFRMDYMVPSAFLDVQAVLSFLQRKDAHPIVRVDGYAMLRDVRITGKDKSPMISLPMVRAVVSPSDMGAREFRLASVTVKDPEFDVSIDRNMNLNLLALIPGNEKDKPIEKNDGKVSTGKEESGAETVFSVDSIRLSGGKLRFTDASRSAPFRTALGDIRIDVDALSTEKGKTANASLALSTEAGELLGLKGSLSLSPQESEGTLTVAKLLLGKYAPYYRDSVLFDVTRGSLDLKTGYVYSNASDGMRFGLKGLEAAINGLRMRQREEEEDFLDVDVLSVRDGRLDLDRKQILAGEFATEKGRLSIRRRPGGKLNISRLVPDGAPSGGAGAAPPNPSGKKTADKPWGVTVGKASVDRYTVRFDDDSTNPPVALAFDGLRLRAENVTTEKGGKGKFSFATAYNRDGKLTLGGSFSLDPPSMNAELRANDLPIGPLQPYYTENVKILLTGGGISAKGNVRVAAPKGGSLQAGYSGEASVNGFSSVDRGKGEDFLKFSALHFGGVDVSYQPTTVAIREISLTDFYSRIIVNPDGTLNVQGIVGKGAAQDNGAESVTGDAAAAPAEGAAVPAEGAPGEGAAPTPVRIDTVTLQGGDVSFSDRYVKPNYSASLAEIGGRISGLSSEADRTADVDLRGKLQRSAPLEITGKINPLAKDLFLDIKVDFRDMDLSLLTPYSGRYAGYEIQKGKLTLNLSYLIEGKKLDARNTVFIDQFTFGGAVDSPDATKLPVRLAVSLLKDRNGEIRLDLPVTGRIDDPKFSVWKIIWKIVGNLLAKAATAPFALIGAMFGGGEELSYLEFEPGRSDVPPAGAGKIANLAKALYERPALKLDIVGRVDAERDPEALREILFRRKVAAQKLKDMVRSGQPAPAVDNVRVDAGEYPKFLALAYKEEKFPKPRNFIGLTKDLPVPEMEKLLRTHLQVTEDDLRQLAMDRAARVRDALAADGKVETGRVFLVEPKVLGAEKKEKQRDSRVDFLIK
jgi:hypothetical protein